MAISWSGWVGSGFGRARLSLDELASTLTLAGEQGGAV